MNRRNAAIWTTVLIVACLLIAGFSLRNRPRARELRILAEATTMPAGGTVVFGDSIVQRSPVSQACTGPTLNAGVGSTTIEQTLAFAPKVLAIAKPRRVILASGVNNALLTESRSIDAFERNYRAMLALVGDRLKGVVEVNPIETDKRFARRFDAAMIPKENQIIDRLAAERNIPVVKAPVSVSGLTRYGVHPNLVGTRAWLRRLSTVCG